MASGLSACGTPREVAYLEELGGNYRGGVGKYQRGAVQGTAHWDGGHVQGSPFVIVDLARQEALFYKGDTLVGMSPISSGTEGRDTPAGDYKILEMDEDHTSSLYGAIIETGTERVVNNDATPKTPVPPGCKYEPSPMFHFMRLTWTGVGMHEGYLPGYPASHGCIRMDKEMAKVFYNHVEKGTPVKVVR